MSVMVHYFSAASYRDFWVFERNVWWQMIWRAPALERGTMLFIPASPFAEGYEMYSPANVIYYPGDAEVAIGAEVLNARTATFIQIGKDRSHYDRSTFVEDHYGNALISVFPASGSCLHVLDGRKVELSGLVDNTLLSMVAGYSMVDRINVNATPAIPPAFLGSEPEHGWCFYYQKMNLARQRGNWDEVAQLADETAKLGLAPNDVSEWMPILEAYATLDREKKARRLSTIIRSDEVARFYLCREMQKGSAYAEPYNYELVKELICGANK
jgi:hypothetical protein